MFAELAPTVVAMSDFFTSPFWRVENLLYLAHTSMALALSLAQKFLELASTLSLSMTLSLAGPLAEYKGWEEEGEEVGEEGGGRVEVTVSQLTVHLPTVLHLKQEAGQGEVGDHTGM